MKKCEFGPLFGRMSLFRGASVRRPTYLFARGKYHTAILTCNFYKVTAKDTGISEYKLGSDTNCTLNEGRLFSSFSNCILLRILLLYMLLLRILPPPQIRLVLKFASE